ncbi:hypothetical protein NDU88_011421 [Pleurodeles waltl]|uniref:Reverse transcriptase RNase H-like domain-containing protein n=1 Tax=Pleurodeles waltl TaxID=8319 RepID=A0AAV7R1L4_PLEWA|nr:hypothetical protein NDU88_011421 [Pleurodeles waltl]
MSGSLLAVPAVKQRLSSGALPCKKLSLRVSLHTCEPPIQWELCVDMFEAYVEVLEDQEGSPERYLALLKHRLGTVGLREFKNLPQIENGGEVDVYQLAKKQLQERYGRKINEVLERYKYIPGKCNVMADGLSRFPIEGENVEVGCDVAFTYEDVLSGLEPHEAVGHGVLTEQEWERELIKYNEMQIVKGYILNGWHAEPALTPKKGREKWIVAYASHTLSQSERNYSMIEKGMLAATWAVQRFRLYMCGQKFTFCTDHKPLVNILCPAGGKNLSPRLARLASKLQMYFFDTEYIPGKCNVVADGLSRLPIEGENVEVECDVAFTYEDVLSGLEPHEDVGHGVLTEQEWERELMKDNEMQIVKGYILNGWPAERMLRGESVILWKLKDELSICGEVILRGDRIVPPKGYEKSL